MVHPIFFFKLLGNTTKPALHNQNGQSSESHKTVKFSKTPSIL
jgi:hypothetical protein